MYNMDGMKVELKVSASVEARLYRKGSKMIFVGEGSDDIYD